MKQVSSMFLRNVTCIDHALVDGYGKIEGGSYHQEIIVSGEVDDTEQVVVDFSKVKKQIKSIIDDKENGYDHKLWIIEGYSRCTYEVFESLIRIKSEHFTLDAPKNAVKIIPGIMFLDATSSVEGFMQQELENGLNQLNNTSCIRVKLSLNEDCFSSANPCMFTYYHGLKNSSSWGCNNIAHGHTSFLEIKGEGGKRLTEVENVVAYYLDGAMLYFKENETSKGVLEYITPRGYFKLEVSDDVKKIEMNTETTIENIVEHVCEKFKPVLEYYGAETVFISEGLQKGALKNL